MSLKKKIILGIVIVLICMQFYPQARNQSSLVTNDHIEKIYEVPKNVKTILVQSCYDCHSDNTRYPWYSYIQPGGRYMAQHIQKGKEELNFSTFG
ncbi:MAG: cytochrome C, partial [Pseudopedobacter saltans]